MQLSIRRSVWSYAKIQSLRSTVVRDRRSLMNLKSEGLILNVGCGPNTHPENINLDYHWRPGVDICCDITNGLPLPDRYVAGIFTEHCLEHIPLNDGANVVAECFRVLIPGGTIRVVVPDLELYIDRYRDGGKMPYGENHAFDGLYTPAMSINRVMHHHGHRFIYDFATLSALLARAGFADIKKTACHTGADMRLARLDSERRAIESLYVEGRRPA